MERLYLLEFNSGGFAAVQFVVYVKNMVLDWEGRICLIINRMRPLPGAYEAEFILPLLQAPQARKYFSPCEYDG